MEGNKEVGLSDFFRKKFGLIPVHSFRHLGNDCINISFINTKLIKGRLTTSLTQVSRWNYNVTMGQTNSRRVNVDDPEDCSHYFTRVIKFVLPLFLRFDTWKRHEYSLANINVTLNCFSPVHLWQLAVWHKIAAANSAVKSSCASDSSIIFGGKAIAWNKLTQLVAHKFPEWENKRSVLWRPNDNHTPPLPVHSSASAELKRIRRALPPTNLDLVRERRQYQMTFHCPRMLARSTP